MEQIITNFLSELFLSWQTYVISGLVVLSGAFVKKSFYGYFDLKEKERKKEKEEDRELEKAAREQFGQTLAENLMIKMNECQKGLNDKIDFIQQESTQQDEVLRTIADNLAKENEQQEESLKRITNGLLSVQGKAFREECLKLLDSKHTYITMEEMEQCIADHDAYNAMGGNHFGDNLFKQVETKFNIQMHK